MDGHGVIVMALNNGRSDNGHDYHEHTTIAEARREAHRLATAVPGEYVIYAPVAIVRRTPLTTEEPVTVQDFDDLPF